MKRLIRMVLVIALFLIPSGIMGGDLVSPQTVIIPLKYGILLKMTMANFDPREHKITKCKVLDWADSVVCLIDGRPVLGTDWEMPESQLIAASVMIKGKEIALDVSCMYNPWFDKPNTEWFSIEPEEGSYIIRGQFSDGAGSYDAEWLVIEGASVRTLLARGEC